MQDTCVICYHFAS